MNIPYAGVRSSSTNLRVVLISSAQETTYMHIAFLSDLSYVGGCDNLSKLSICLFLVK